MALPPTQLTDLMYRVPFTIPSLLAILEENGCLSERARTERAVLLASLERGLIEHEQRMAGKTGPNSIDAVASALVKGGWLSNRGIAFSQADRRSSTPVGQDADPLSEKRGFFASFGRWLRINR